MKGPWFEVVYVLCIPEFRTQGRKEEVTPGLKLVVMVVSVSN